MQKINCAALMKFAERTQKISRGLTNTKIGERDGEIIQSRRRKS